MATDLLLSYARPSGLELDARRLRLETATPATARVVAPTRPRFFDGFLLEPAVAASALRQVALVAGAAYVDRQRPIGGGADPLVTSDGARLRFEAFSRCGGVMARYDVLPAGLDGAFLRFGTTNVDVNEPLRRLLTRVTDGDFLHLNVGSEGLVATSPNESALERKVSLSDRWLRGLAEAQASGAKFDVRAEVSGTDVQRFLNRLPQRAEGWLVPNNAGFRLTSRAIPGAVWLSRSDRLATLVPLLRHAHRVRLFGPAVKPGDRHATSAWVVDLPGGRFTLHTSASPEQGFSGDGTVLSSLTEPGNGQSDDAHLVAALIDGDAAAGAGLPTAAAGLVDGREAREPLDPVALAEGAGIDDARVRAALAALAVAGRVGYDVAEASYFHRDLPYADGIVARLNPRLRAAELLVSEGGVKLISPTRADVRGTATTHRVRLSKDGTESCTCRWWTTHEGRRGPCRHVLATRLVRA